MNPNTTINTAIENHIAVSTKSKTDERMRSTLKSRVNNVFRYFFLLFFLPCIAHATVYKCVVSGETIYTSVPCVTGSSGVVSVTTVTSQGTISSSSTIPKITSTSASSVSAGTGSGVSTSVSTPSMPPLQSSDFSSGYLRGVNLENVNYGGSAYVDSDFANLAAMKVNLTRVFLHLTRCAGCSSYSFSAAELAYIQGILKQGEHYGFKVVVTVAPQPAGSSSDYWNNDSFLKSIAQNWQQIATSLKSYPALAAYDLINEPVPPGTLSVQQQAWHNFATSLVTSIRAVDPTHVIIFEPAPWGLPSSFTINLEPLSFSNIVYSFHFYETHAFTHQGIMPNPYGIEYPNTTSNIVSLSKSLDPVRAFVKRTGAPIYIGEVSAVRWAPNDSASRYLKDSLELFEVEKWSWTYFSYRGYDGWDAEIPYTIPNSITAKVAAAQRVPHTSSLDILNTYFPLNKSY